jgi:hypothetical protein
MKAGKKKKDKNVIKKEDRYRYYSENRKKKK